MKQVNKRTTDKRETIFEMEHRLKQEAKDISKNHVDVKPIIYKLKQWNT